MDRLLNVLALLMLIVCTDIVSAQKIVAGSDIPTIKSMKDNIVWLNGQPESEKYQIIDFYEPVNRSCVSNVKRLLNLINGREERLNIIILTKESGKDIHEFAKSVDGKLFIGIDTTGNGYFEKCFVKYLPYTLFVDNRNKLIWHGFLCSLSDETIDVNISDMEIKE